MTIARKVVASRFASVFYDGDRMLTDDEIIKAFKRLAELESLVSEVISEPPTSSCADNGTSCPFCCAEYNYHNPLFGKPQVTHSKDCWLVRASAAL